MIVHKATTLRTVLKENWRVLLLILSIIVTIQFLEEVYAFTEKVFSLTTLSILITALVIFLVFRFNEAYERWWEPYKLWEELVVRSRILGSQIISTIKPAQVSSIKSVPEQTAVRRELVNRHLAYVNALRISLRASEPLPLPPEKWGEVKPYLSEEEFGTVQNTSNVPVQLLSTQYKAFERLFGDTSLGVWTMFDTEDILDDLAKAQGGCERIKNTVFPDIVSYTVRIFVWTLAVLIPIGIIETDHRFSFDDVIEVVVGTLIVFVLMEKVGRDLKEPFSGGPNDVPMTALCRNIEIDLLEQLGEQDIPPPIAPREGILM